ncbi:MAG TPA: CHAD domain-containing protein [Gemmatimonadaceae bacterium]|jgi:CHAD domain-containing protein/CYTH domain-containing protein|nr:CHAD domain-containing protein [Gemmatimonadaceae bacterium]
MHLTEWSLREPAGRATRVAALELLAKVRENRDRLDDTADAEALHDFRVSVRRLRSWLRAFDSLVSDTLPKKASKRLARIAHATGASRDLEVHLAWVDERKKTLRGEQRRGADWLTDILGQRKTDSDLELKQIVNAEFDRATQRVERSMSTYAASVVDVEVPFAAVASRLVRRHVTALMKASKLVTSIGDRAEAHATRIAAKRLRYLLDPLDDALPAVKEIVDELGVLQDRLGELHDAQLFGSEIATSVAEQLASRGGVDSGIRGATAKQRRHRSDSDYEDPVPGLLALARRLRKSEETAFAAVDDAWLGKGLASLMARVEEIADALERIGKRGREVRRRYLLKALPADALAASAVEIDIGYVAGEHIDEQLRRERATEGVAYYRILNAGHGVFRVSVEDATTERVFDAMWPLAKGSRLRMRRHRIETGGRIWDVVELVDHALVVAEVDVGRNENVPAIPEWLEPVLDKDVTGDAAYEPQRLAR